MTKLQHLIERMSRLMTPLQRLKQCEVAKVRYHLDKTKYVWIVSHNGRNNTSIWAWGYEYYSAGEAQLHLNGWIKEELENIAWRKMFSTR